MYENVLVPTDMSEGSDRAVQRGLDLAENYGATLHLLYVVDEDVYGETPALSSDELFYDELEEEAVDAMDDIADRAAGRDVAVETQTRRGTPHEEITAYAEENDVGVIVMGRHGAGEHGAHHLGSVTDRTIRETDIPVMTV